MKTEIEGTPVCMFRDEKHEAKTKKDLETARLLMQSLYDQFLALDLGEYKDINELLMRPESVYRTLIDQLIMIPESKGRFAIDKERYKESLSLPDPSRLYDLAKTIRQKNYCAVPDLFEIDGKTVVLNKEVSTFYIEMQNLYLSDPAKIELVEEMIKLCELLNSLNSKTSGEMLPNTPASNEYFSGKFILHQEFDRSPFKISVSPDYLRQLVQR
jgi:hypothetical protein